MVKSNNAFTVDLIYNDHMETVNNVVQVDHAENTMVLWRLHEIPVSARIPEKIRVFGPKVEKVEK